MNNEITITSEQLAEMLNLIGKYGTIGDIYAASAIYEETRSRKAERDEYWAHLSGLANVLRIGYILGQRTERKRRRRTGAAA